MPKKMRGVLLIPEDATSFAFLYPVEGMGELTEEEMDQFLAEKYGHMVREDDLSPDSDLGTNIIPFKPKCTLH